MDRDRRIEMEVNAATEIAKILLKECGRFIGNLRMEMTREVPRKAALIAHEMTNEVLRNNLGQDE